MSYSEDPIYRYYKYIITPAPKDHTSPLPIP